MDKITETLLSYVKVPLDELLKDFYTRVKDKLLRVYNVGEEVNKLSDTVNRIKAVLKDAEERRIVEDAAVLQRLSDYRAIVLDAEDVVEEFRAREEASRVPGTRKRKRFTFSFEVASLVEDIQKRLKNIDSDRNLALSHADAPPKGSRNEDSRPPAEEGSLHDNSRFHGREEERSRLVDALKLGDHSNLVVISIEGIGGIGKTALAKAVYAIEDGELNFDSRIWIDMSDGEFDVPGTTRKIIEAVTGDIKCSLTTLNSLHMRLKGLLSDKRFLLVLDNVADTNFDQSEKLLQPLIGNEKGSRVLVTTRKADVGRDMRAWPRISLGDLGKMACWELFQDRAFAKKEKRTKELEDCGREIVEKLGGSPLLVKSIGSFLYLADKEEWHEFRNVMLQVDAKNVLQALKVSYDQLPSHLRRCFEFCSTFPKGYVFDKDELVRLWMALDLVEKTNNSQVKLERIGSKYFDQLWWRSFFQPCDGEESGHKEYTMPSLIHELAQMVSAHECFTAIGNDVHGVAAKSRYAFYKDSKKIEKIGEHQCLRALVLHGQDKDQTNLEKILCGSRSKMRFLRVLDLRCNQLKELQEWILELTLLRHLALPGSQIEQLPESIGVLFKLETLELSGCDRLRGLPDSVGNLRHLKYLGLRQTAMTSLPASLCSITSLQKLDLGGCSGLSELPNDIGNLAALTHLHLNYTCIGKLPDSVSKLTKLSLLDLGYCYELEELPEGLSRLTNLRRLDLQLDWEKWDRKKDLRSIPPEIGQLKYLQTLSRFSVGAKKNCGIEQLKNLSSIKELCISKLENVAEINDVMSAKIEERKHIEVLILRWSSQVGAGDAKVSPQSVIEQLRPPTNIKHLWIENYFGTDLPSWISDSSFKNLERLRLLDCKSCCQLPELGELSALKFLHIKGLDGIKNLELIHGDRPGSFSSLKTFILSQMSNLSTLNMSGIASLLELSITDCPVLKQVCHLPSTLKRFELRNCESLEFSEQPPSSYLRYLTVENCSKEIFNWILDLTSLSSLSVSQVEVVKLSSQPFKGLKKLKSLKIESCDLLETLSENNWLQSLTSLESLEISSCSEFSFGGDAVPDTLKELRLRSCKKLKDLPELPSGGLKHLTIKCCPGLQRRCQQNGIPFYNFWTTSKWDQVKNIEELDID